MQITRTQKRALINIFRSNLAIRGMADMAGEIKYLMANDLVIGTRQHYIMQRRTGAIAINRATRLKIFEIFEMSVNQMAFESDI